MMGQWNCKKSQEHVLFLMDVFRIGNNYTPQEMQSLNFVRIYLQVTVVSDISNAAGDSVTKEA